MWAISNSAACCKVPVNKGLSGALGLIIFSLRLSVGKLCSLRKAQCSQQSEILHTSSTGPSRLWTVQCVRFNPRAAQTIWGPPASVPGMLDPVAYHPLLTGASLDHQAEAKVGIFGHFYLQAPTSVPADDWAILQHKHMKNWTCLHSNE